LSFASLAAIAYSGNFFPAHPVTHCNFLLTMPSHISQMIGPARF